MVTESYIFHCKPDYQYFQIFPCRKNAAKEDIFEMEEGGGLSKSRESNPEQIYQNFLTSVKDEKYYIGYLKSLEENILENKYIKAKN